MGGSRRKMKKNRAKVRVALPKKNPRAFKPAFNLHPKLRTLLDEANTPSSAPIWDDEGSVIKNYKSFGFVSNPNWLSVRSRTPHIVESASLQVPAPPRSPSDEDSGEDDPVDTGSDLEEEDLKSALGKTRRDGKSGVLQPLTALQRVHVGHMVEKHRDDYQRMFMDTKLNSMQHSVATLEKLCTRFHMYKDKNAMILSA